MKWEDQNSELMAVLLSNQLQFNNISVTLSRRYDPTASFSQSNLPKMTFGLKLKKNEQFLVPTRPFLTLLLLKFIIFFLLFIKPKWTATIITPSARESMLPLLPQKEKRKRQNNKVSNLGMTFLCICCQFLHLQSIFFSISQA